MTAKLMCKKAVAGHFSPGIIYLAIYDAEGRGWFTVDDQGAQHWLSPSDENTHMDIVQETWVKDNFSIVNVQ